MLQYRLIYLRNKKKKTQQEIADMLGITRPAYTAYEMGKRKPDYEFIQKLADFYDVSIDYLLGRTDDPTPPGEDAEIDPEWNEIYEKVKQKGAELEATALLRSASKLNKNQMKDILRILEMIEKEEDE